MKNALFSQKSRFTTVLSALCCLLFLTLLTQAGNVKATDKQQGPYLFELLERPDFLESWQALFSGEKGVPSWLADYAITKDGPASPGKEITIDGKLNLAAFVCKAHSCPRNGFYVLFTENGKQAWGLLLDEIGKDMRYFNRPDPEIQKALQVATEVL